MKNGIVNFCGFILITLGTVFALYQVQVKANAQGADPHTGHAHAQESSLGEENHGEEEQHVHNESEPRTMNSLESETEDTDHASAGEHESEHEHEHGEIPSPDRKESPQLDHDHEHEGEGHSETAEGFLCMTYNVLEAECGICQPQMAAQLKPGESMKVRLASSLSAEKAGIQIGKPLEGSIDREQTYLCEAIFNPNRSIHISPLTDGVVQKVHVNLGDSVQSGQILAELASSEIANAKSAFLKALEQERLKKLTFERESDLAKKNITAKQDFQQAEAEYQVAQTETRTTRQQLVNFGLSDNDIESVISQRSNSAILKVRSPFQGTVVDQHAVLGEAIQTGEDLFQIVDLSTMWMELSIPESQISSLQIGETIRVDFSTLPGQNFEGKLTWISPRIDENTRMMKARAAVPNPDGILKQGLFGQARLLRASNEKQVLIPSEAVQQIDGRNFVFVKSANDLFELRYVLPGNRSQTQMEITEGLSAQDEIVIRNSFVLKSEFLKSRFGAGCAHD